MTIEEAINKTILHLAKQENCDLEFGFYSLVTELSVPNGIQPNLLNKMSSGGLIKGKPALNPKIKITKKGNELADKLKDAYFNQYDIPLNPNNTMTATIDESCEIIFQMHCNDTFNHYWTKESFDNKPTNLSAAKRLMLAKGVIQNGRTPYTNLNPELYGISNYKDALVIIESKSK